MEQGARAQRPVEFVDYNPGGESATVIFGYNRSQPKHFSVPLSELRRTPAPEPVWFLPGGAITIPAPPKPLTTTQITQRLDRAREVLQAAHATAKQEREAKQATGELVERTSKEHEAARAALLTLDAHLKSEALKLEQALRANETPAPTESNGQDRGYVVSRVAMTESALQKFQQEDQAAQGRLNDALAAITTAALEVVTLLLERDCEKLREAEEIILQYRADLLRITQWWPAGVSHGPIKVSEASARLLTNPPDYDRVRLMSSDRVIEPWKDVLDKLVEGDVDAEFATVTEEIAAPVAA
jgi:hypothetical protein